MERLLHRSADGRLTVRHVRLAGSNEEIGWELGRLAARRHGADADDVRLPPALATARREWAETHHPEGAARRTGIARSFGLDPDDPSVDALGVAFNMAVPAPPRAVGCSVLTAQTDAGPVLQRNFDFGFASLVEMVQGEDAGGLWPSMLGEPYLMEIRPTDGGHASLFTCAFDLANGVIDGINETGLSVAMLQLVDGAGDLAAVPAVQPGLNELEVLRFLLDRCATVDEADRVFSTLPPYLSWIACHWVVADASGAVLLVEPSTSGPALTTIHRDGALACTNHSLLREVPARWADDPEMIDSRRRLRLLDAVVAGGDPAGVDAVTVSATRPDGRVLGGTLWSAAYHPATRSVSFRFWDGPGGRTGHPVLSDAYHYGLG